MQSGWDGDAGGERGFGCSLHLMLVKLIVKPALKVNLLSICVLTTFL